MTPDPLFLQSELGRGRFTHLFACIVEEDDGGYLVQIRLYDESQPRNGAWGEELADSLETASSLIAALAAEYSIRPELVQLELRLADLGGTTRH